MTQAASNCSPRQISLLNRENTGNFVVLTALEGIGAWLKRRIGGYLYKNSLLENNREFFSQNREFITEKQGSYRASRELRFGPNIDPGN